MQDRILIIDFGSQVTQLIARRVREAGVYCEIHPFQAVDKADLEKFDPRAIILSGGPASVIEGEAPSANPAIFQSKVPVLGICYGEQTMAHQLGGQVESGHHREFGRAVLDVKADSALFRDVWKPGERHQVWMSHGDRVTKLPPGFSVIATSENAPFAAIADEARRYYAVQFHPEVMHTPDGAKLLRNFALNIAGCSGGWTMAAFKERAIAQVRAQVGKGKVICGLSGGVDSAVAAVLIHEAIGDQLTCVFVDHGLLRLDEGKQVMDIFDRNLGVRVIHVDASEQFMSKLAGVTDPEQKRKIIGKEFVEVFQAEAGKLKNARWLAQGTIYPDVIESGAAKDGPAATIKLHHNVGGLPDDLKFKLIEPLRSLFKDEVRQVGLQLGLPEDLIWRQPFPGPGLGIRIIGEVTENNLRVLRKADAIAREELKLASLDRKIWQCPVVLIADVRSVGVQGDGRTYGHPIVLRPVSSEDAMTADWTRLPHEVLAKMSNRITNEIDDVTWVSYVISSKPPATIEPQ